MLMGFWSHLGTVAVRHAGLLLAFAGCVSLPAHAGLADTIQGVKPSIVGIGTLQHQRRHRIQVRGTGFVVGDGNTVITNAHVVPRKLNDKQGEFVAIFFRQGKGTGSRRATEIARDETHDISVLRIRGAPMRPLKLLPKQRVREGDLIAFTGFPIGAVLGLYPATHRGIVSALTPFAIPVHGNKKLSLAQRKKLARPFEIYQLDAIAYPGNSGSPVYDVRSGGVLAVINSVFVKGSREDVISHPSGISYAIPIRHVQRLLDKLGRKKPAGR
jgi:S1-C subfamily serine protease